MKVSKPVILFFILILFSFQVLSQESGGSSLSDLAQVRKGRSKAITSSDPDFNSNYDRRTYIEPGETMVMADITGPAII